MNVELAVIVDETEFANLFIKKLTLDRVVPTSPASVSWLMLGITSSGLPSFPKLASSRRMRASRFSLELNKLIH